MKKYLLDTNTVIFALKKNPNIRQKLESLDPDQLAISSVTLAEILVGIEKSEHKMKNTMALAKFLAPFTVFDFTVKEAHQYALIRAELERKGRTIGPNDYLIAATALSHSRVAVTDNVSEFSRVAGLEVENWLRHNA